MEMSWSSGGSLPGPDAGHLLHGTGGHDNEDQGAEVPGQRHSVASQKVDHSVS